MRRIRFLSIGFIIVFIAMATYAYVRGPKNKRTGAPGEQICIASKCHVDYELNSGPGKLSVLGIPQRYTPGETYQITVRLQQKGQKRWGFELTAINADSSEAGSITKFDHSLMQLDQDEVWGKTRFYLKHTRRGTHRGEKNGHVEWQFTWQAPDSSEGPISFYVAGNAGNDNREPTGDYIYQTEITSQPPAGNSESADNSDESVKPDTSNPAQ